MSQHRTPHFEFRIDHVFYMAGQILVTGFVTKGAIRVGASVTLRCADGSKRFVTIKQIEAFRKIHQEALVGESLGLMLEGVEKGQLAPGDLIISPDTDAAH